MNKDYYKPYEGRDIKILDQHAANTIAEDHLTFPYQLLDHLAHVLMLKEQGIISQEDAAQILGAVLKLRREGPDIVPHKPGLTDLYSNVEEWVIAQVGIQVGGKMHTGRSRNDMNPAIERMYIRRKLLEQPEDKAKEIALSLELYTTGSLDIFGRESTVDLSKPYVVFDIHGLGEQLKPAGSLVITDTILNRVTLNWKRGKRTHVFIDEFHVMFENEQSGIFFNSAWRQFRKRGAYPTAITQNVEYLLDSVQASTMLSNSEFLVMLSQAASDRAKLAKLLNISNEQMSYVTNADAGCGLIRYGSALVPFINRFPRDTRLYALMTTKPGEGVFGGEEVPA